MTAQEICARASSLKGQRLTLESLWQEIAQLSSPRKAQITRITTPGSEVDEMVMYDMTLGQASLVEAAGMMSNITPGTDRWCAFGAPAWLKARLGDDVGASYYEKISQITIDLLAASNFYSSIHEAYLNRNDFGTCCVYTQAGTKSALNFRSVPIKEFVFAVDDQKNVDTVFRTFRLTARQAVKQFGSDRLPEAVRNAASDPKRVDADFEFIHCVYPRDEVYRKPGARDGMNKAFASVYVAKDGETIVSEGGFDEMPYAVSRYLERDESVWGYGPAEFCLPTARQVNLLEQNLDILSEVSANPRLLIPSGLAGNVDLRAGGQTIFDESTKELPREWLTNGRYDIGAERIKEKQEFIKKAFHNDLFQMFSGLERDITAYQAMQMVNEKLDSFGPTFLLLTTELLTPILQRVFGILQRAGYYPKPPPEIIVPLPGGGLAYPVPAVEFNSKFALAMKAAQNRSFVETSQLLQPLLSIRPDVMDNFDADKAARGVARNAGYPDDWILPEDAVAAMRAQRAQQAAAQQAIVAAQGIGKAAADVSKASPDIQNRLAGMMN